EVNWNDVESIYSWIKPLKHSDEIFTPKKSKDLKTSRQNTETTTLSHILANGPGTGKSRFLQELPNLLYNETEYYTDDKELLDMIKNRMYTINVTFGNSTVASPEDVPTAKGSNTL
ncbi:11920_t:CDS:2, partial [Entrophospora sp. SA101]